MAAMRGAGAAGTHNRLGREWWPCVMRGARDVSEKWGTKRSMQTELNARHTQHSGASPSKLAKQEEAKSRSTSATTALAF